MKIIFKIARAELRTLFFSPIAWVVIVVFFVISGMQFVSPLMDGARIQEIEKTNSPGWNGFTGPLTLNMFLGTLGQCLKYLYLFVPLITMGTINREETSGTMKLLSSSPVRIREIVLGKYLGLQGFNLALMSAVGLLLFTGYLTIQNAEPLWLWSIMLGLLLVSSTYMAIGLFISCLTNYQIVAGIITFLAFFVLEVAGGFFQHYDFIRDLTWFLQISGRTETMIAGLITTKDLFYFLLIISLFLGLAMIRLKSKHESKKWTVPAGRNLALIALVLLLGYVSSRPGYIGYLDVTRNKLNTIDPATQAVLKELDGSPVTVTLYTNLLGANLSFGVPGARNVYIQSFWSKYIRFYPNIQLKYEYYYDIPKGDSMLYKAFKNKSIHHIAKQMARMSKNDLDLFQKPGEINKQVDLSREPMRLVMELEYKGKKALLRTFDFIIWPPEPVVSASLMKLTRNQQPEVKFTTGHYERSPWRNGEREYGSHTNNTLQTTAMINNGMIADTVSFLQGGLTDKPKFLVVADPKSALEKSEQDSILRYIEEGGNAIFYAEPGKQQMLNPVLNKMGVNVENGRILFKKKENENPDWVQGFMTKAGALMAKEQAMLNYQKNSDAIIISSFSGAAVINYSDTNGFVIEPIFTMPGNKNAWIEKGYFREDSAASVFEPEKGDLQQDEYVLGIKMTRKLNNREQRIVVMGDADFMSPGYSNGGAIGLGLYSWLADNEYPVYTRGIEHKDKFLTIGRSTGKLLWYVFVYAIPGLLLITGTILLIRRKRK